MNSYSLPSSSNLILSGDADERLSMATSASSSSSLFSNIPKHLSKLSASKRPKGEVKLGKGYKLHKFDVICGRSRDAFHNPGNRRFRMAINLYLQEYAATSDRATRTKLNIKILSQIHACGGKFVKQNSGEWIEIKDAEARHKIGHALRDTIVWRENNTECSQTTKLTAYITKIIKKRSNLQDPKEFKQIVDTAVELLAESETSSMVSSSSSDSNTSDGSRNKKRKQQAKKTIEQALLDQRKVVTPPPPPVPEVSFSSEDFESLFSTPPKKQSLQRNSTVEKVLTEWSSSMPLIDFSTEDYGTGKNVSFGLPTAKTSSSFDICDPQDWEQIVNVLAV